MFTAHIDLKAFADYSANLSFTSPTIMPTHPTHRGPQAKVEKPLTTVLTPTHSLAGLSLCR